MAPQVLLQASPGWFCLEFTPIHQKPISSSSFPMNPAYSKFPYHRQRNHYLLSIQVGVLHNDFLIDLSFLSTYQFPNIVDLSSCIIVLAINMLNLSYFTCCFLVSNSWLQKDPTNGFRLAERCQSHIHGSSPRAHCLTELFPVSWDFSAYDYGSDPWIPLLKHP